MFVFIHSICLVINCLVSFCNFYLSIVQCKCNECFVAFRGF